MINNTNKRIIYSLSCPFTNNVHYIGKSESGMMRPFEHMTNSHSEKIRLWVTELKDLGYRPNVNICEYVPFEIDINDREKYWISKYINDGCILLNIQSTNTLSILTNLDSLLNDGNDFKSKLSSFIRTKRKISNLTQSDFASKAGVGLRWIREVEQEEEKTFSLDTILHVLNMFGCTLDIVKISKKYETNNELIQNK